MRDVTKAAAYKFVILLGITSLFADMTYESARSINGAYLAILGANAATVGFVAGFGELIGYALRYFSGYVADKTGRYWTITLIGYCINLSAVPLLALAGEWQIAAVLIVLERLGKALRIPSRDAMLSHAAHRLGAGWAFGLHEALDRAGAMLGPLIIALMLYKHDSYVFIYAVLTIPALFALFSILTAYFMYPKPHELEHLSTNLETRGITKVFWLYLAAAALLGAGYADFSLMAYHFSKTGILSSMLIPLSYAIAMGVSAIAAPLLGHYYDRRGFIVLIIVTIISIPFAPLVFLGDAQMAFIGVVLWSIGMCANDSLMRAVITNMVSIHKRGTAYGLFGMGYGIAWFIGSVILGVLYDINIRYLVAFSVIVQLLALPIFWMVLRRIKQNLLLRF